MPPRRTHPAILDRRRGVGLPRSALASRSTTTSPPPRPRPLAPEAAAPPLWMGISSNVGIGVSGGGRSATSRELAVRLRALGLGVVDGDRLSEAGASDSRTVGDDHVVDEVPEYRCTSWTTCSESLVRGSNIVITMPESLSPELMFCWTRETLRSSCPRPSRRVVLALDRHDQLLGRRERVDRQQAERGWAIEEDEVIHTVADGLDRLLQPRLARTGHGSISAPARSIVAGTACSRSTRVGTIARSMSASRRRRHTRCISGVVPDPHPGRGVPLRIEVRHQHAVPDVGERRAQAHRRRALADATLLVGDRDDPSLARASGTRGASSWIASASQEGCGRVRRRTRRDVPAEALLTVGS